MTHIFERQLGKIVLLIWLTSLGFICAGAFEMQLILPSSKDSVFPWVANVMYEGKRAQLYLYVLFGALLGLVSSGLCFLRWRSKAAQVIWETKTQSKFATEIVILSLAWNHFWILNSTDYVTLSKVLIYLFFWTISLTVVLFVLVNPMSLDSFFGKFDTILHSKKIRVLKVTFLSLLLVLICKSYWSIYSPLTKGEFIFQNEYFNSASLVNFDGQSIDDIDFFNANSNSCLKKWDPRRLLPNLNRPVYYFTGDYLAAEKHGYLYRYDLFFDPFLKAFSLRSFLNENVKTEFVKFLKQQNSFNEEVFEKFISSSELRLSAVSQKPKPTDFYFAKSVHTINLQQVQSRWYIHHHNFILAPMLKLEAGQSWRDIFFQYGLGTTVILKNVMSFLNERISLRTYFQAWSSMFFVYFVMFAICVFLISRSLYATVISLAWMVALVLQQEYQFAFLGPGLTPLRHFLDVAILCTFFFMLSSRPQRRFYFWLILVLCIANFFLNPEFGIFLSASVLFGLVIDFIVADQKPMRRSSLILYSTVFIGVHALLWFFLRQGTHEVVNYYKDGFFSAPLEMDVFLVIFGLYLGLSAFVLLLGKYNFLAAHRLLAFTSLNYSLGVTLYFVWGRTIAHFVNISSIYVFSVFCVLLFVLKASEFQSLSRVSKAGLATCLLLISFIFYDNSQRKFTKSEKAYRQYNDQFEVFHWSHPNVNLRFTTDQRLFVESAALIEKSVNQSVKRIFLFSRFDNILPLMAGKALAFRANELSSYLMSSHEFDVSYKQILDEAPEFVFTDRDILISSINELVDPVCPLPIVELASESYMRTQRLSLVKLLFSKIQRNYEPIESAGFLTVWKKTGK